METGLAIGQAGGSVMTQPIALSLDTLRLGELNGTFLRREKLS